MRLALESAAALKLDLPGLAQARKLYDDVAARYRGEHPAFEKCDTAYHDVQHVLEVSLAMARLALSLREGLDALEEVGTAKARLTQRDQLLLDVQPVHRFLKTRGHVTRRRRGDGRAAPARRGVSDARRGVRPPRRRYCDGTARAAAGPGR